MLETETQSESDNFKIEEHLAMSAGFGVYGGTDLMKMQFRPKEALIEGMINVGETVIVCGTPKAGKSVFLQSLAFALSGGEDKFLGTLQIKKACKVCYIQLEGELADTHDRFRRIATGTKHNLENLCLFFSEPMKLDELEYALSHVIPSIEKVMIPDVLIIDPLYMAFAGSLSDDEIVRKVLATLRIIKMYFGCTLILAHHTHKIRRNDKGEVVHEGDEAMFGSQFLKAYPDHVLMLHYDSRNGNRILYCMTQRSATIEKEIKLRLNEPEPLFFEEFIEHPKGLVLEFAKRRVLELLASYQRPLCAKEIYSKLEIPRSTFFSVIKDMIERKEVLHHGNTYSKV